jgi:hypothetical protein
MEPIAVTPALLVKVIVPVGAAPLRAVLDMVMVSVRATVVAEPYTTLVGTAARATLSLPTTSVAEVAVALP